MSLGKRSFLAAAWEFGSVSVQAILQLTVTAVLARHLTPADFGLVAIANMAVGFLVMFSEIGVGPAIIQKAKLTEKDVSAAFSFSLLLGVLGMSCLWLLAPVVATYFKAPDSVDILKALSLSLVIASYTTVASATLERELDFKRLARANVASYTLAFGVLGIALALYGAGVWAIVVAMLVQGILRALFIGKTSIRFSFASMRGDALGGLIRFGAGVSLSRILNYVALQIDNLIVGRALGTAMLGFYQMAFQIMDLPRRFLGGVIDKVMFSAMSRMEGDVAKLRAGYLQAIELINILMFPTCIIGIILAPELVRALLGSKWLEIVIPLQILLVQVPLRGSIRMTDQLGSAIGRNASIASRKFIYAVFIGIAALIGMQWRLAGVASAVTIVVLINYLMMVRLALEICEADWRDYLRACLPGVRLAMIVLATTSASIFVARSVLDSYLLAMIVTVAITFAVIGIAVLLRPALLGSSGMWLVGNISGLFKPTSK